MSLTRRDFLRAALAAGAVGGVAACGHDDDGAEALTRRPYDLCVIGSGFAGMPLALEASAAGLETLVVEAGPDLAGSFRCSRSGGVDYDVEAARLIAVGGASNHWEGIVNRMRPSDFRLRSEFGLDVDWPLDYESLRPWYCLAERALYVEGYPPGAGEPPRSCPYPEEPGVVYRPPRLEVRGRSLGYSPLAFSRRDGGPLRLRDAEVPTFARSPHGSLLSSHRVSRLVTLDGSRIDHAELRGPAGETRRVRARIFVVAAGVIESARLLLLSRSEWFPEGLGNRGDQLGRYFVEHPTFRWEVTPRSLAALYPDGIYRGPNRSYDPSDALREEGLNAIHLQFRVDRERVVLKVQPELEPQAGNRVTLSRSERDPFGDALPHLHFELSERDRRTEARGVELIEEQIRALGASPSRADRTLKWRWHPSGTLRMGFDDSNGVVDRDLRVFGIENLYVSGAAAFPTSGTANPTLTVVALSLRLAEHLLERIARRPPGSIT